MTTAQLTPTETGIERLRASAPYPLPFAPQLHARAYVLERPAGDVLIYGAGEPEADLARAAGPLSRRYLSHHHEAMFAADIPGVPLFVHGAGYDSVEKGFHVRGTFSRRHALDEDLEVIPIPGHTPDATAFLWNNGSERVLFTGDSIYLSHGRWIGALLDSSDRDAYLESLDLLQNLEFDILVPWAASAGEPPVSWTDPTDSRRRIGAIIDRIRSEGTR